MCFDRLPFDGVTADVVAAVVAAAAVADDDGVRFEREVADPDGDDGIGSVLATCVGDAFSTETYENKKTDAIEKEKTSELVYQERVRREEYSFVIECLRIRNQ